MSRMCGRWNLARKHQSCESSQIAVVKSNVLCYIPLKLFLPLKSQCSPPSNKNAQLTYEPLYVKKTCCISYVNNKGADQPSDQCHHYSLPRQYTIFILIKVPLVPIFIWKKWLINDVQNGFQTLNFLYICPHFVSGTPLRLLNCNTPRGIY